MGKIVREVAEGVTKHYWYPGEKADWIRAGITIIGGAALYGLIFMVFGNSLLAAVIASCAVLGVAGAYLGRKDVTGLESFHDPTSERRAAMADGTRAAWRGALQGVASAGAAIFVLNMPHEGFLADWVLPFIPSIIGALAHSAGMLWQRMAQEQEVSAPKPPAPEPETAPAEEPAEAAS